MPTCTCKIPSYSFMILCLISLVSVSVIKASSSSNITLGSSLSAAHNQTSYWLSPSSNFAFGFYQFYPNQHVIGIWIHPTNSKTLVWTSSHDCNFNSSIYLNQDGMFLVQSPGEKARPLFNLDRNGKNTSFASMQDNGNFVVYGLNGEEILWQSFDYPTDTILGGQTLRTEHNLFTQQLGGYGGDYRLTVERVDGDLTTSKDQIKWGVIWKGDQLREGTKGGDTVLKLDADGRLYLFDWYNNVIARNFTDGFEDDTNRSILYRAKLGAKGIFSLYREIIGVENVNSTVVVENTNSTVVWVNVSEDDFTWKQGLFVAGMVVVLVLIAWLTCFHGFDKLRGCVAKCT